ncbi:MAG: glycosyltransferase [Planctomycetota bacterium]
MRSTAQRPRRILLYSHDSQGLGHLRRSLTLASRLVETLGDVNAVVATGSPCATHFQVPRGVDLVKLPSVGKDADGAYVSRTLDLPVESTIALRRTLLEGLWNGFRPDLLVVDHQVTGLFDEVVPLLERSRESGTRTILGVRDVIDAPERVAEEWGRDRVRWALREGYDRVCVYGSEKVFDARAAYPFPPELGQRLEYVGYVVRREARTGPAAMPEPLPEVLVTTGGGEDGEKRIAAYLEACALARPTWQSTIVTGPMLSLDAERRLRLAGRNVPNVEWHRFLDDLPQRMARADAVVSMAGYNTVAELLAARRRPVLLPRRRPRREQEIRAGALERLGLAYVADERDPRGLRNCVEAALDRRERAEMPGVALDGVDGLTAVARELLDESGSRIVRRTGVRA